MIGSFHLFLKVAVDKWMSMKVLLTFLTEKKNLFCTNKKFVYLIFINKLLWYHPKITYKNIIQKDMNKFLESDSRNFLTQNGVQVSTYVFEIDFIKNRYSYPSPSDVWCWSPCGLTGKGNLASHIFDVFVVGSAEQSWWVFDNDLNNRRRGCASPLIERLTWILTRMLLGDLQNKW